MGKVFGNEEVGESFWGQVNVRLTIKLKAMGAHIFALQHTDEDRRQAAVRVQAWWRCILTRRWSLIVYALRDVQRHLQLMTIAAGMIQARFRAYITRKLLKGRIWQKIQERQVQRAREMDAAIIQIVRVQRAFRYNLAHRRMQSKLAQHRMQLIMEQTPSQHYATHDALCASRSSSRENCFVNAKPAGDPSTRASTSMTMREGTPVPSEPARASSSMSNRRPDSRQGVTPNEDVSVCRSASATAIDDSDAGAHRVVDDFECLDELAPEVGMNFYLTTSLESVRHKIGGRRVIKPRSALERLSSEEVSDRELDAMWSPGRAAVKEGWDACARFPRGDVADDLDPHEAQTIRKLVRGHSPEPGGLVPLDRCMRNCGLTRSPYHRPRRPAGQPPPAHSRRRARNRALAASKAGTEELHPLLVNAPPMLAALPAVGKMGDCSWSAARKICNLAC